MKKKFAALCALCLAASLTAGCSNSSEPESALSDGISIKGLCGEDITVADFFEKISERFSGSELEPAFSAYSYEGFGYYSPSDGQVGIKTHCEPYNEEPFIERLAPDYQHIDVGDKIGGLKLKSASGTLFDIDGELKLEQQELCFSGSLTLKGYIHLCVGDELYCEEDDLLFYPSDGEWKDLPFNDHNWSTVYLGENYDFYWCGNVPIIHLGKVSDRYYSEVLEVSDNPKEVTVTISDIVLKNCFTDSFFGANSNRNSATLEDIRF